MHAKEAVAVHPGGEKFDLMYIDLLTEQECSQVRSDVHELMRYKTKTRIGAASYKVYPYVGSRLNRYLYSRKAKKLNPILRDRLGWLYDRLASSLSEALQAPTRYPEELGSPGFHVYQKAIREKTSLLPGVSSHFDMQWKKID